MDTHSQNISSTNNCTHHHHHDTHAAKAKTVVTISALAMILEIIVGYYTNSMALLTDGIHMASHVMAIGLTWFAYVFIKKNKDNERFKNGTDKVLSLSGYTSAIILLLIALMMIVESFGRIVKPEQIDYSDALIVAIIGLVVNLVSAKVLHHDHEHSDHNIKAAYLHILADVLTSVFAIVALCVGKLLNVSWLDAISGILGSVIILKWSISLIIQSGKKLLDYSHE